MKFSILLILTSVLTSCGSFDFKDSEIKEIEKNDEYDKAIKVKVYKEKESSIIKKKESQEDSKNRVTNKSSSKSSSQKDRKKPRKSSPSESSSKAREGKTTQKAAGQPKTAASRDRKDKKVEENMQQEGKKGPAKHLPEIEDAKGFDGRRPIKDPFRVGEETVLTVSYFGVSAGEVIFRVNDFVEVNGEKAYHFTAHANSNKVFSLFYKVRDWVETFVNFENLRPYNYSMHVRESKQIREVRTLFDWETHTAKMWEKLNRGGKKSEKNKEWKILPYSQNIVSAFFYLRTFEYEVGKNIKYRVADEKQNIVVTYKTQKKETLDTKMGDIGAFRLSAEFEYGGVFKPVGEVLVWLSNDDRKRIVRMETKIKLGTLVFALDRYK